MTNDSERFLGSSRNCKEAAVIAIAVVTLVLLLTPSFSEESDAASSGTCGDNLTWSLNYYGTLTISGSGEMYDYKQGEAPWYSISDSIKTLTVNGAENIGNQAFFKCTSLTEARLGDVTSIGTKAFAYCNSLKNVDFDDSLVSIGAYAFYRCSNLNTIDLEGPAKTLRSIGSYAFYQCLKLSEVCIPSYINTIGNGAFSLTFADPYGNTIKTEPDLLRGYKYGNVDGILVRQPNVEVGTIFQSDGLTYKVTSSIPAEAALTGYTGILKKLTVPQKRTLGAYSFNITEIEKNAFKGCKTLREVNVGNVEKVGAYAFYGCTALGTVNLGSVTSIGSKAFALCYALCTVNFGDSLKTVGNYAFFKDYALSKISLPNTVTTVGTYAFYKCYAMESASLGSSLKNIRSYAFAYCENLESIKFPDSLSTVDSKAFLGLKLRDYNGKTVASSADALRGKDFTGSQGVLSTDKFTVRIVASPSDFGQVSMDSLIVKYGTSITIADNKLTVGSTNIYATATTTYDGSVCYFESMKVTTGNSSKVLKDTVITAYFGKDVTVDFKVASSCSGRGTVSASDSFIVAAGTPVMINGNTIILGDYGSNTATPAAETARYVYTFTKWTGADDNKTAVPSTITENTTLWAHFTKTAIPYSVVIKYMCDGAPILKDGADIRVNSQGEWGQTYSYNYLDNSKFDETMAAKYSLIKGYIEQPSNPTNQGETITTTINSNLTVFVFEFSKEGAYVQFHRQFNPVASPVYESPEPYGNTHYATLQAAQESDAGKVIQVLITDDVDEQTHAASGTFIGAGQTSTYNGYEYSVVQLPKETKNGLTYDRVEVVISGGLNTHDDINDPLVVWYQLVGISGCPVTIKYMCDGSPILKNGEDIKIDSQGKLGETYSYNYLDNPKFDEDMASRYRLTKGYVEQPSNPTNQGETVTTTVAKETVIVFEFSKRGAYVQFHRQCGPVANPVYETPEPCGQAHHATLQAAQESDAGKVIQVLITDPTTNTSVEGKFIGAGKSGTYNGYTYSVIQLPKLVKDGKTYDAVEIVIAGELNVHDDINDPLVIWYQLV
ncbi:MAG: leucine-rich repeat domain-containing protein [Candidatus Methanomethylophilaceae archaeon]|nr:leucine-rich repeat domain-containing protein [Candidatus Methanomethylophilaceae archaeon]